MSSYQYRNSHCGDKTVVRSSYLHNGISYTGKMTSLYWFGPLPSENTPCHPMVTHILHIIEFILNPFHSKSKRNKVKVTNLNTLPKHQILRFKKNWHATHLLKLLNKMFKYEMDPASMVEDTERTQFHPQTDGQMDGRTDGWMGGQKDIEF